MLIICITHADARRTKASHIFRSLTEQGREEVRHAANRFQELAMRILRDQYDKKLSIERILSSPKARCIETALLFADELRDLTKTSDISISEKLDEKQDGILTSEDLVSVIRNENSQAILIACHGDLANALPPSALRSQENQGGWFKQRPVFALIDYDPEAGWESAKVLCCEGYEASPWKNLSVF
ncbi:phosphoglycerate mutase family protein [Azotobacter chroococcum]|uniref:phosphoglycerate mutase family protein n=2 Tax=Azotobacter chroococcum TaxID=353 RepID=UPI0013F16219